MECSSVSAGGPRADGSALCCCRKWREKVCDGCCDFSREGKSRRLPPRDFCGGRLRGTARARGGGEARAPGQGGADAVTSGQWGGGGPGRALAGLAGNRSCRRDSSGSSSPQVPVDSSEEGEQPPAAPAELAAQKREQRLRKFRELHLKRNEARKLNHQEVVEEDKRLKLPANWEARKARLEWELQEEEKKKECAARGEDYEKVKLLEISAEDAERWERKKRRKNPDLGFSDYAAAQLRQYHRLTKQIKPDMETYERLREKHGEEFFPTSNSLLHGTHVPSTEEVDRMVIDLEKQIEKRDKYSRRRPYNDDADIDYINERNAKFNKKAERFYGKYTAEIKQNLERGTAV
uniref:Pre-mRNA-splicing factor SYF2 n=1 Tax=Canis lupus familiaris TaxID=9615 RepID=A0A8C0LW56_CANLF